MNFQKLAVWILGPIGAGKSTLSKSFAALGFAVIDQDRDAEAGMRSLGLPLDTRLHSAQQAKQFQALREQVADRVWQQAQHMRDAGMPLVYEATGNKPHYLEQEVHSDRAAGYRVFALGINTSLALCQQRNAMRERVLGSDLVASTWHDFQRYQLDGIYQKIFGAEAFQLLDGVLAFDVGVWLTKLHQPAKGFVP